MTLEMSGKIYDYPQICASVMQIDSKIRFAGVINERGRLVGGGMRENVEPLENEKDDEMIFMELALRVKMRKEFDRSLGKVRYVHVEREKVSQLVIYSKRNIVFFTMEPEMSINKKMLLITKIKNLTSDL